MSTDEGKESILNPEGQEPILKCFFWSSEQFAKIIKDRVVLYLNDFIKSEATKRKFKEILNDFEKLYEKLSTELVEIENDADLPTELRNKMKSLKTNTELTNRKSDDFADKFFAIPKLIGEALLNIIILGVGIVLIPIFVGMIFYENTEREKRKFIYDAYEKLKSEIRSTITKTLHETYGEFIIDRIRKFLFESLCTRIKSFWDLIIYIIEFRQELLAKKAFFCELEEKVKSIEKRANELQEHF